MTGKDKLIVRAFREKDLPTLRSLIQQTILACYPAHYGAAAVRFFIDYHSEQAIRRDAQEGHTLVLTKAGRLVGTGTVIGEEIRRVFVDPAFQKQGIGRLLMQRLEEAAVARAVTIVKLDASLPSKAFYDRLAYVTVEKTSRPMEGGQPLDYFRMQQVLATSLG